MMLLGLLIIVNSKKIADVGAPAIEPYLTDFILTVSLLALAFILVKQTFFTSKKR
jgi:heme/copper-type cytochrome/quinol oxidase subunit 4